MSWEQFWFVLIGCVLAMWACRVIPLFLLKGRELPPRLAQALGFIPPAAFAALVANDLLNPCSTRACGRRPSRSWPLWHRRSWP